MRNLISSYTRFASVVYSEEVKVEVGTRSRIEINYKFRQYSLAIFRLIMRNLISSYNGFACVQYIWEVKVDVDTRFRKEINYMFRHYSLAIFR